MFYNEDHLRITKVRTADGVTPMMDENERVAKKIIHAPLNAATKKLFEEQNTRLPNPLKMKIEVIKAYNPHPVNNSNATNVSELEKRIAELEKQNADLKSQQTKTEANGLQNGAPEAKSAHQDTKEASTQTKAVQNDKK